MTHRTTQLHHENPDRAKLVWELANGPILVADMSLEHIEKALAFADRAGFESDAIPAMRARLGQGR